MLSLVYIQIATMMTNKWAPIIRSRLVNWPKDQSLFRLLAPTDNKTSDSFYRRFLARPSVPSPQHESTQLIPIKAIFNSINFNFLHLHRRLYLYSFMHSASGEDRQTPIPYWLETSATVFVNIRNSTWVMLRLMPNETLWMKPEAEATLTFQKGSTWSDKTHHFFFIIS